MAVGALSALCLGTAPAASADDPVFFSWLRTDASAGSPVPTIPASGTTLKYTYMPRPGGGHGWGIGPSKYVHNVWNQMEAAGQPAGLTPTTRNLPWGSCPSFDTIIGPPDYPNYDPANTYSPNTLAKAFADRYWASINSVGGTTDHQISYVLCDIEPSFFTFTEIDQFLENAETIIRGDCRLGVEADPLGTGTINVPAATITSWQPIYFGNYNTHRREYDAVNGHYVNYAAIWQSQGTDVHGDLSGQHNLFLNRDLNVIMPVSYFYGVYTRHVDHNGFNHWTGDEAPSLRAGYMWAALERHSAAVREEIAHGSLTGKKVIPFVSPFIEGPDNPATPGATYADGWITPAEDFLALVKHLRLREADGFYFFVKSKNDWDPSGSSTMLDTYWSQQDMLGNYLNPYYDATAEWADPMEPVNGSEWFEKHAIVSWEELDGEFAADAPGYRFADDKTTGVLVSAVNDKGRLSIMISFMDDPNGAPNTPLPVDIDNYFKAAKDYSGSTATSVIDVLPYSHTFTRDFFTPDLDADGDADNDDTTVFTTLWGDGDLRADWNQDGFIDTLDLNLYFAANKDFNN
jgi:hypothetical protein